MAPELPVATPKRLAGGGAMKIPEPLEGPVVALALGAGAFALLALTRLVGWLR
jgi:hypothetical protein